MKPTFGLKDARGNGKDLFVAHTLPDCPDLPVLEITVDNDDVDQARTAFYLRKMFTILNDHWDDPVYASLRVPPNVNDFSCEDVQAIFESLVLEEEETGE